MTAGANKGFNTQPALVLRAELHARKAGTYKKLLEDNSVEPVGVINWE